MTIPKKNAVLRFSTDDKKRLAKLGVNAEQIDSLERKLHLMKEDLIQRPPFGDVREEFDDLIKSLVDVQTWFERARISYGPRTAKNVSAGHIGLAAAAWSQYQRKIDDPETRELRPERIDPLFLISSLKDICEKARQEQFPDGLQSTKQNGKRVVGMIIDSLVDSVGGGTAQRPGEALVALIAGLDSEENQGPLGSAVAYKHPTGRELEKIVQIVFDTIDSGRSVDVAINAYRKSCKIDGK
jgi:hypothetical protein